MFSSAWTADRIAGELARRKPVELELAQFQQAAVAAILLGPPAGGETELLLIERALRQGDPWSGHMALPGGRREPSDPDLGATAVREVREETGIDLAGARLLGRLDDLRPIRRSSLGIAVRPFVFWVAERPKLVLSDEVADTLWVPLFSLGARAAETDVQHRGESLRVPAYLVEQRVVWGMTQRVLENLLQVTA